MFKKESDSLGCTYQLETKGTCSKLGNCATELSAFFSAAASVRKSRSIPEGNKNTTANTTTLTTICLHCPVANLQHLGSPHAENKAHTIPHTIPAASAKVHNETTTKTSSPATSPLFQVFRPFCRVHDLIVSWPVDQPQLLHICVWLCSSRSWRLFCSCLLCACACWGAAADRSGLKGVDACCTASYIKYLETHRERCHQGFHLHM